MNTQSPIILPHNVPSWENVKQLLNKVPTNWDEFLELYNSISAKRDYPKLLHKILEDGYFPNFFTKVIKTILDLAIDIETLFPTQMHKIPSTDERKCILSRLQVASLLANVFLGTLPKQAESWFSFDIIFAGNESETAVPLGIIHYFERISDDKSAVSSGKILFHSHALTNLPDWSSINKPLGNLIIHKEGKIEDDIGMLQVDFANRCLGGGVLRGGRRQEEIRFGVLNPELIASMIFMHTMEENETIIFNAFERFSDYEGYDRTLKWKGDHRDQEQKSSDSTIKSQMVAMDAVAFAMDGQWKEKLVQRDLNKAFCGFQFCKECSEFIEESSNDNTHTSTCRPIATGNWGTGVFGGDHELKFVVQWLAASLVGRDLHYFTMGERNLHETFPPLCQLLQNQKCTIGQLYQVVIRYGEDLFKILNTEEIENFPTLFQYLMEKFSTKPSKCCVM